MATATTDLRHDRQLIGITNAITAWRMNKTHLAIRCGMNPYTFKMKLAGHPPYKFTRADLAKVAETLRELAAEIEAVCQPIA